MNRIVMKIRSLAAGDLPMEDISDWSVEPTDIDKFLYQTSHGFSKKAMKYMQGKKIPSINAKNSTIATFFKNCNRRNSKIFRCLF